MSSGWAFSTEMNRMMSNAENALTGRGAGSRETPRSSQQHRGESIQPLLYPYSGSGRGGTVAMYPQDDYALGASGHPSSASYAEVTRQLSVCMNEVRELRHELALERDARSTVMTSFAKRIKEEITGDVRSVEHHLQRSVREMEAEFVQRLTEQDNARALMKRAVDDALRQLKVQDRSQFDTAEQFREHMDDLRSRVDQSVVLSQQLRSELVQRFEREAATHAHRLDVELVRYAEMHRQQQHALVETRRSVADEVAQVSKTIAALVDDCWGRRQATIAKSLEDHVATTRQQMEAQGQSVSDMSVKIAQFTKDMRSEVVLSTADVRDRVVSLESGMPLLSSRVDRFERKADAVFETANKLTAQVDVIQQACDKMLVQAGRSIERSQKLEDVANERDERILRCESQLTAISGLDRVKVDVEGLRKGLTRIEGMMENVKQVADRDERLVDAMQRNIDSSLERADAVEKKAHKVVARVETAEQRLMGFVDRIIAMEDQGDRLTASAEQTTSGMEAMSQRLTAMEHRQRLSQEKFDTTFKDVVDRILSVETRTEAAVDASTRSDTIGSHNKKEFDRIEKRITKLESHSSNTLDNLKETRQAMDSVLRDYATTSKKLDQWKETLDRKSAILDTKLSELDATGVSLSERFTRNDRRVASLMEALETRVDERVELVSKRMDELHAAASRRATQDIVGGHSSRSIAAGVVDETLAVEVGAARRRLDALEVRLRQLEAKNNAQDEDLVQRHELNAVTAQVRAIDAAWKQSAERLRNDWMHRSADVPPPRGDAAGSTATASSLAVDVPSYVRPQSLMVAQQPSAAPQSPSRIEAFDGGVERVSSPDASPAMRRQTVPLHTDYEHSSVSSMHGGGDMMMLDDVSEVTALSVGPATQPPPAVASSAGPGLPPLASGATSTFKDPSNTATPQPAIAPKPQPKKRSPYSDTSESERDGGALATPEKPAAPAAQTRLAPSDPPLTGGQQRSIASTFDDDDDEFEINDDTLRGESQALGDNSSTFVLDASRSVVPLPLAAAAPEGAVTTDDDVAFLGRRPAPQRRAFVSAGDTSSAGEAPSATVAAPAEKPAAGQATVDGGGQAQVKKFHARKTSASALRSSFDDLDSEEEDEESSPREGSQARSRSSRKSAGSRRTTDVSLSLNSSKKNTQSSRRREEEAVDDIEDDDQLAEMLGFLDAKKRK